MEGSLFNLQQMINDSNSESGSSYSSRTSNKSESQIVEPEKIGQDESNESYNKEKSSYTKSENQTSKRTSNINEMSNYKNTIIQKHDILQLKVGTILSDKKNVSKIIKHIFKKIMDINKINQSYNEILKEINNTNQKFFYLYVFVYYYFFDLYYFFLLIFYYMTYLYYLYPLFF